MKCPKCNSENPETARFCAECGTQIPAEEISVPTKTLEVPKEELTTGSTFAGRYQIIEELGKGGMGKVYRALDKKLNEEVALKLIKPEIASDKKTVERFSNELKFARKIVHKNVGRMYELMEEKGTHFITMEYVPGQNLKGLIRQTGQLALGTVISLARQICDGLAEAHKLGVVHRDLKPQNIMIDREGSARNMDFGIARSIKGKGITGAGVIIGTPEYMSPEQVEGKEVDQRSDIYSLGIILYEMVIGQVPFEAETPFAIGMKHKSEIPKDPKELNAQIPEDFSRVILKCLEKDKEKRYQSAGEVRSEFVNIEKGIPTTERAIPKRKPITSREITVQFSLKKIFIPALVVVAAAIIGIIVWQLLPPKKPIPLPSDKPSLAVMYFENNTGDENLEYLRSGLSEWLTTDLSQSKFINVLSGDRVFSILKKLDLVEAKKYSAEDLSSMARESGVNHILKGSYIKIGENFVITAMLQKPQTGELVSSIKVECEGVQGIPAQVDELTRKIKSKLDLTPEQIASDIDKEVGKITTSSPEAYKYFLQAIKYFNQGESLKAIELHKKAIAVDPEFASAYRSLSISYSQIGDRSERKKYLQKAMELSDRVSDRERYRIQAEFYSYSEKTYDKAIEAFRRMLELYPDAGYARNNLASKYNTLEQWDKAIELFQWHLQNKVAYHQPYGNISASYMAKGLYDKATEILEHYLSNVSNHVSTRTGLASAYLCQGKYDLALAEVDKTLSLYPGFFQPIRMKGDIHLCKDDLIEAEKAYQTLVKMEEPLAKNYGRRRLGALYLLQGRFAESKAQAKQGIELAKSLDRAEWEAFFHLQLSRIHLIAGNPQQALRECKGAWESAVEAESLSSQRNALYWKGLAYLEVKSMAEAERTAEELKGLIDEGLNKKIMRLYHNLMGKIELQREKYPQAIECFKKAVALLSFQWDTGDDHAIYLEPLALAYYEAGNLDKAKEEYERITSLTVGRIYYGDIYAKSFYMLGKISQQKGWKGKALENYQKFLDLWNNADPGLPEVEDAKKRLAALQELS